MGLKVCGINPDLNITPQRRELQPHGTLDFPCAGYAECYSPTPTTRCPGTGTTIWRSSTSFRVS